MWPLVGFKGVIRYGEFKQRRIDGERKPHEVWSSGEDSLFYYHRSEDRIVLSHAMFWVMSQPQCLKGKIRKEKLPFGDYFLASG